MGRLFAIGLIWFGCAIAWMILGSTILVRTGDMSSALTSQVHLLWGPPMEQRPAQAVFLEVRKVTETVTTRDAHGTEQRSEKERLVTEERPIALDGTEVTAKLALEHRRKGLVWFPTYDVDFRGRYTFRNDSGEPRQVEMRFPLATANALYDGFRVSDAEGTVLEADIKDGMARWTADFAEGQERQYLIAYRSRGTSTWHYQLAAGTGEVKNFQLAMETDFAKVDFPAGTISPSQHQVTGSGWRGQWSFDSLISSSPIGVELPGLLNPGPLASRITFFAPVGLLFFFFVVAVFAAAKRQDIHPLNYFFFGCAFFAFHLLFAYLVDHLAIAPAFALASAVSIFLVVSYARLFVSWRFALLQMGVAQLLYLVLFSFTFFWQGVTGLAITVGAILTLFVMMQLTGRVRWAKLAPSKPPVPPPAEPAVQGMVP